MSTLPEQVQRQLDAADQIVEGLTTPPPDDPPAPPEEPPAEPPAQDPPPPPPPATSDETDWKQKYLSLQGVHRSDINRLNGEIDLLKAKVAELTTRPAEPPKPPEPAPAKKLVTEQDVEAFGPDLVDMIRRAAREIADEEMGPIKAKLEATEAELAATKGTVETVATTQSRSTKDKFMGELAQLVPDWSTVNADTGFLQWLNEVDAFAGVPRQELLDDAAAKFDAQRVARIFNAYKDTTAPPAPPPAPKDDLTRLVQPGSNRVPAPTEAPAKPKTWTAQAIDDFYKAMARGDYKGREADAKRIEAEIDQALSIGAITA